MAKPSKLRLYLAAEIATLTAALFGYTVGLIGGLLVLPSFLAHFQLSSLSDSALASAQARIVSIWLVGAFFGVPLGIPVCARWGRRICLVVSAGFYVLGAGLQLGAVRLEVFELGRFVNGLGVGVGTLVGPMYISEVSPASDRGMLMSGYQTLLQLSALGGFWIAFGADQIFSDSSKLQWQIPVFVQLVPGSLLLLGTMFIPETPRFLAGKGRWQRATESLMWLRNVSRDDDPVLVQEMVEIREAVETSQAVQARQKTSFFKEIIKRPIRRRLHVGVGLMIAQNMVGLNALNYYAPVIFMSAGFTSVSSSLFLTGIFGLVKLISAACFMFIFVHVKGNRFWLKFGSLICGISMLVLAVLVRSLVSTSAPTTPTLSSLAAAAKESSLTSQGVLSVILVCLFAFAFGVSLGPISWNVCAEIFPLHLNAKCCAITTCTQWLFQIVIAAITPRLLASVGWITYLIFGGFCFLTFAWVWACVPETRGVPLGRRMDELFEDGRRPDRRKRSDDADDDDDETAIEEVEDLEPDERTSLLWKEREVVRRRSSCVAV